MTPPLPPDNSPSDPADPADPAVTISTTADFGHDPRQCDCAACQHIRYSASDAPLIEYAEARFLQGLIEGGGLADDGFSAAAGWQRVFDLGRRMTGASPAPRRIAGILASTAILAD